MHKAGMRLWRALSSVYRKGAVVLGVSKDSVASHKKFETKYELPFTLLSDTELSCIQAYDVWKEKICTAKNNGRGAYHIFN